MGEAVAAVKWVTAEGGPMCGLLAAGLAGSVLANIRLWRAIRARDAHTERVMERLLDRLADAGRGAE